MRQGCNYIHICGASISSWARSCSVYRYGCMCGKIRHQVIFINNILQNLSNKINLPDGCVAERMADYTDNTGGPARAVWETWTVSEASWAWVGLWRVAERMRNKGKYKKNDGKECSCTSDGNVASDGCLPLNFLLSRTSESFIVLICLFNLVNKENIKTRF